MPVDFSQKRHHLRWAENVLGVNFDSTPATWLTQIDQRGNILGVVVFSRFTTTGCEVTLVIPNPTLSLRSLYIAAFSYLFVQCELERVTAFIAVDNEQSLSLAQRLGFQVEGKARCWYPGVDAYILGLLRHEFKWLKDCYGQPFSPASPQPDCNGERAS